MNNLIFDVGSMNTHWFRKRFKTTNFSKIRGSYGGNQQILVISIVIDSDKGHCYEHLKKKINLQWKLNAWHVFECLCVGWFLSSQKCQKKLSFGHFRPNLPQLGLFYPYFSCKNNFRVISIIKMVILDLSRPISVYLKNKKIQNSKIKNS